MQTDSTDLAYLAGVIDADGYVTATRSRHGGRVYFGAQVGITGSCSAPHTLAAQIFGGNVSHHQPTRDRAHHRTQYHWQRGGSRAVPVITAVLPYLRVKYERARLVLELQEHVDWIRETRRDDDPFPWMPAGYDPNQHLCEMVEEIRSFNARAGRTWDQYPQAVIRLMLDIIRHLALEGPMQPVLHTGWWMPGERFARWLAPLRGRDLGCWCPPGQPCHATVLLEISNQEATA